MSTETDAGDDSHEPSPSAPAARPARLTSRKGWFGVWKAEIALINERCGETSASVKAVWLALLQLQNDRQSSEFDVPINLIAWLAGVHRSTVKRSIRQLISLDFLSVKNRKVEGKKEHDLSHYQLLKGSVHKKPRLVHKEPKVGSGRPNLKNRKLKEAFSEGEKAKRKKKDKNAGASSLLLPPSASQGGAASASGERPLKFSEM